MVRAANDEADDGDDDDDEGEVLQQRTMVDCVLT